MPKKRPMPEGSLLCENAEYVAYANDTQIAIHDSTPEGPGEEVATVDVLDASRQESLANFMQHAIREVRRRLGEAASTDDSASGDDA